MAEIERMLKTLIKSLENKPLNPGILGPFSPTKLEKNLIKNPASIRKEKRGFGLRFTPLEALRICPLTGLFFTFSLPNY